MGESLYASLLSTLLSSCCACSAERFVQDEYERLVKEGKKRDPSTRQRDAPYDQLFEKNFGFIEYSYECEIM